MGSFSRQLGTVTNVMLRRGACGRVRAVRRDTGGRGNMEVGDRH